MPSAQIDGPIVKRQKRITVAKVTAGVQRQPAIFAPFRTVGLVSPTNVPFTSVPLGKTTFQITTSIGRSLQTYDLKRGLNLIFISHPQTAANITATLAYKTKVLAAFGNRANNEPQGIWVFQRGRKVAELDVPADLKEPITQLLVFGQWIVGAAKTLIEVWKADTFDHYTTIHLTATTLGDNEITGGITNMPTYLNKIFVGRKNGWVEIWNISTGKLLYTMVPPSADLGAVVCMRPTPALSLLAIAYESGPLIIQDVLYDRPVVQIMAGTVKTPVSSISFRTDGLGASQDGTKDGVMATTSVTSGDVTFWDLNKGGRIMGVLRSAHNPPVAHGKLVRGGIAKVDFLAGQPLIITSGRDNSLKSWIFDETPFSPIPRILHSRSGHAGPVSCLHFLPSDFDGSEAGNKWLLSGSLDRSLWGWSLRRDGQSTELSQGAIRNKAKKAGILSLSTLTHGPTTSLEDLKAPEITCIASSLNRDGGMGAIPGKLHIWQKILGNQKSKKIFTDAEISSMTGWESIVTGHKDDPFARTWFWGRKRAGRWMFQTADGTNVSSVAISSCGHFALVGSEGGSLEMFNLQSGNSQQRFPSRLTPAQARQLKMQQLRQADGISQLQSKVSSAAFPPGTGQHTGAVTGVVVDNLNKFIISTGIDGRVKFWDFLTGNLLHQIEWTNISITALRYHADNDLLAIACSDNSIRIIDMETHRTIREFRGAAGAILDLCFSNDGRWVIASAADSVIRVYDLATGHLIDGIRLESPCSALAMSATGEYLATAIGGDMGVNIWTNKSLFRHVTTRQISETELAVTQAPTASGEGGTAILEAALDDKPEEIEEGVVVSTIDQLDKEMLTLSLVPKARWQTLIHLDLIKQRNKPKETPKVPETVPFFLPSIGGGREINKTKGEKKESESRITRLEKMRAQELFTEKLFSASASGDYTPFIEHLKSLAPSTTDFELRSLSPGSSGPAGNELLHFIRALTQRLKARRDYELMQAWMSVFLRLHSDTIIASEALLAELTEWKATQEKESARLDDLVGYCSGVVRFLRSPQM